MSEPRYKARKRPDANSEFPWDVIDTADGGRVVLASAPDTIIIATVEAMNAAYRQGHEDGSNDGYEEAVQQ